MGVQPSIDAFDMESVLAFGKQPEDLGGLEPGEANGALESVFLTQKGSESENGQRLNDGTVNARVLSIGRHIWCIYTSASGINRM